MTWFASLILVVLLMLTLLAGGVELRRRRRAGALPKQQRSGLEEGDAAGRPQQLLVQEWRDGRLVIIGTCVIDGEPF